MRREAAVALALLSAVACKKNVERAETGKVSEPPKQAEQGEPRERSEEVSDDHLRGIIKLDSGYGSTCALDDRGNVFCWGHIEHPSNEKGVSRPWRIGGLPEVRDMRVGGRALATDGKMYFWGFQVSPYYEPIAECLEDPNSRRCQIGPRYEFDPAFDPKLAEQKYPDEVSTATIPDWVKAQRPQARDTRRGMFSRITTEGEFLTGAGVYNRAKDEVTFYGTTPFVFSVKPGVLALLAGWRGDEDWAWCFLYRSGEVDCPSKPVLGDPEPMPPERSRLPARIRSVGTDGAHGGVVALDDGRVMSWNREATVHPFVEGIVEVDGGPGRACGIDRAGKVQCWLHWHARDRPLSAEERAASQPRSISGIDDAVEITSSGGHSCVALSDGRVKCWGRNEAGECGVGHYAEEVEEPAYVLGPDNMEAGS